MPELHLHVLDERAKPVLDDTYDPDKLRDWYLELDREVRRLRRELSDTTNLGMNVVEQRDALLREKTQIEADLTAELDGAKATIEHLTTAMSWVSGHDRKGLDHLADAETLAEQTDALVRLLPVQFDGGTIDIDGDYVHRYLPEAEKIGGRSEWAMRYTQAARWGIRQERRADRYEQAIRGLIREPSAATPDEGTAVGTDAPPAADTRMASA